MSVIEGGGRTNRVGPAPGGNGRLQGSEPFDQDQTEGGPRGPEPFDQDWTGENQTGKDERLWVALTGGPGCQGCVREAVSRGPGRSIWIGRRGSDRGNRWLRAAPLLSAAVRSPSLRLAWARVAPGSSELGRGEEGATANSMAGKRP
jgi:hypothetical protein